MYLIDPIILKRDKFDEGGILEQKNREESKQRKPFK